MGQKSGKAEGVYWKEVDRKLLAGGMLTVISHYKHYGKKKIMVIVMV